MAVEPSRKSLNCPKLPWMMDFFSTHHGTVPKYQLKSAFANDQMEYLCNLNHLSKVPIKMLTSFICTIGPKTETVQSLEKLIENGMRVARLKLALYDYDKCLKVIGNIRTATDNFSKKIGTMFPLAIAIDIRGPEIRVGMFKDSSKEELLLEEGALVDVTSDPSYEELVTENMIYIDYQNINAVEPGDKLFINNEVTLSAIAIVGSIVKCIVERAGKLISRGSVCLESSIIDVTSVAERDLQFCVDQNIDIIMASVIDNMSLNNIKDALGEKGAPIKIIAKIENSIAIHNLNDIVANSDGIMLVRSELRNDIPVQKLFILQKKIAAICNKVGKPVIISPGFNDADSELKISEAMDLANIILDGYDGIVFTKQTSISTNPIAVLQAYAAICKEAEAAVFTKEIFKLLTQENISPVEPLYALAISVVEASFKCQSAAIILNTTSGRTAELIAKYRPRCPIVVICRCDRVTRQLQIVRGIDPIHYTNPMIAKYSKDVKTRIQFGLTYAKCKGYVAVGDTVVLVTGYRVGRGFPNSLNIFYVSDIDTPSADQGKILW